MARDFKLPFLYRFDNGSNALPGRCYVHALGFESAFGGDIKKAHSYYSDILFSDALDSMRKHSFDIVHSVLWGKDDGTRMIDFFAWDYGRRKDAADWNIVNPDIYSYAVLEKDLFSPTEVVGCADGLLVMAIEDVHRREQEKRAYFEFPPQSPMLDLKRDYCLNKSDFAELVSK